MRRLRLPARRRQGLLHRHRSRHDTGCDVSGCRGEILKIASVSGNTATVATALHFPYDPVVNAANVSKLANPAIGVIVQNLTF